MSPQNMYFNNFTVDKDNVFEEVPYGANILNVKSGSLKEEDEIEIKEENLCELNKSDENVDIAADTGKLEGIGWIQQTEITSNASELLTIKTANMENICYATKSSPPDIETSRTCTIDDIFKNCLKKRGLKMQFSSYKKEQFLFCDKCNYQTKNKHQLNRHCLLHDSTAKLLNCSKWDTSLVINSKLCNECFKCVQFPNLMIEPVRKNEQKILVNLQNISEKSTCRLCLSNEKLEAAVCLKNTNEEVRHIIEMDKMDLDFDLFRKPVKYNNCCPIAKSIYLFKEKCFAMEKILKYYCATNKINSLDRKELDMVSFCHEEKLQQFSEILDEQTFLCDKNAESICTYLNNFSNNEHDVFEECQR